jgi:hypothetical protein
MIAKNFSKYPLGVLIMEGTMKTIFLSTLLTAVFMNSLHGQALDIQHPPASRLTKSQNELSH